MSPRPAAAHDAMDVETTTVLSSTPHDPIQHQPIDDDTKRMTIAPLVIPSRSPKPSSLPTTTSAEQPTLLTCYAGLFARLPSLGQILNSQYAHAQELYNHLFAPSTPVADPDTPNPAFHHSAPPRDASIPITSPFSDLVDAFVDIPSSLADVHNMSRPTAPPLTLSNPPTQQPTSQFNFAPLLQFLTSTINPHLTHLVSQPTHSCFIILVVGYSTHSMAGPALHSHLVSSFTALPGDDVSVVYIPTDLIQGFPEPTDWHPLLVYTTVALAYPDLPFLVVSPEYIAGATFSPASLRTLLSPSASMVVFSSSSSIIVPDVLLHLPPHVKIQGDAPMPDATDPGSPLHSLLTQCAYRHGIFTIGAEDLDTEALADFLSQPDTTQNTVPAVFTAASWLHTHQISTFGTWDPMPLCLALTYNAQISYFYLSLNQHSPPSNTHTFSAGYFEWSGKLFGSPPISCDNFLRS